MFHRDSRGSDCYTAYWKTGKREKGKEGITIYLKIWPGFLFFFLPINFGLSRKEVGGAGIRCAWLEALVPVQCTGVHLPTRIQSFVWTSCLSPPHVARKSLGPTTILSLSLSELHLFIFSHTLASLFLSLIEYLFVEGLKQPQITWEDHIQGWLQTST